MKASAQSLCNNILSRAHKEKIEVTPMKLLVCILLSLWKPENELVKSGFEAFKLIVMTILGYIFGSNNSKSD